MIDRDLHVQRITGLLKRFPVVALLGARQVGKTTLAGLIAPSLSDHNTRFDLENPADVARLADSNSIVVTCPTTEGNLGDGILPGLRYRDAAVRLAIGTDQEPVASTYWSARKSPRVVRTPVIRPRSS